MTTHKLKTWPEYFEAILDGTKTFELRKNDRGFQVGDLLVLQEYVPHRESYTGRSITKKITYVMQCGMAAENDILRGGHVALGICDP